MSRFIGNLSLVGFLDGFTALCIIISSVLFGMLSFYKAKKKEANLLAVAGLAMIFVGCFWLGPATDFFAILITGDHLNPLYIYGWLGFMFMTPAIVSGFYLGAELLIPEKKKIIVSIYAVLGIIFEILIFSMPVGPSGVFIFNERGEGDLIDTSFNIMNPAFWLIIFFLASLFIFLVIGFAIKAAQSTGDLKKKFRFISLGWLIFIVCGVFDSLFAPGEYLVIWRFTMMTFSLWMYLGLKS